jgi:hypothetical protein
VAWRGVELRAVGRLSRAAAEHPAPRRTGAARRRARGRAAVGASACSPSISSALAGSSSARPRCA